MILLQLRANFGKLHGTLTLHEGLNELCLPNEAGKSTWSAFLLAMLYGIDTRERATRENQNLPGQGALPSVGRQLHGGRDRPDLERPRHHDRAALAGPDAHGRLPRL